MWWQPGRQEKNRSLFQRLFRPEAAAAAPLRIAPAASMPAPVRVVSLVSCTPSPVAWPTLPAARVPEPTRVVTLSAIQEQVSWTGVSQAERPSSAAVSRPGRRTRRAGGDSRSSLVERLRRVLAPSLEALLPGLDAALTWPGDLMPFQKDGVRALMNSERMLLADDMGLGKTLQAIAAVRILYAQRAIASTLVVAPASLLDSGGGSLRNGRRSFAPSSYAARLSIGRGNGKQRCT